MTNNEAAATVERFGSEDAGIVCFLGTPTKVAPYAQAVKLCEKLNTAYEMIPDGAAGVPEHKIGAFRGKLMDGILRDSLKIVYGVTGERGMRGFDCSVFWVPTKKEFENLIAQEGFWFERKGGR